MEGQPNGQESKQELIKQIKDRLEILDGQIENFLEKSGAANAYNELLLVEQNTPSLGKMPLEELEAHQDIVFFNHLQQLKKWYQESLKTTEREN